VKSAVDVSSSALYRLTIRIRSDDTIRQNTNTLFGPLLGTEANTKQIFGTSLIRTQFMIMLDYANTH